MTTFAGSAIGQGKGQVSSYRKSSVHTRWLLLSGAFDPPDSINISERRSKTKDGVRSGDFLHGVTKDIDNMRECLKENDLQLDNMVLDIYLTKEDARKQIRNFFERCKQKRQWPMLYYTGHGEVGTGNWCFDDGTLSLEEVLDLLPCGNYYPHIFCDTCYSGHWANACAKETGKADCLSACPEFSMAYDTSNGGELTLYMTGKLSRPRTEPLYSKGTISCFPIPFEYSKVEYVSFVGSHLKNSQDILIWQQISEGTFTGIFGGSKLHSSPAMSWWKTSSYQPLKEWIEKSWSSKNIYSLAFDGTNSGHYAACLMDGFGSAQSLLVGTDNISKGWDDGKYITSCTADYSNFFIVMTKDAPGVRCQQMFRTRSKWTEILAELNSHINSGWIMTGLCYCSGKGQYLLVMSKKTAGQSSRWFREDEVEEKNSWIKEKYREDHHPTIMMTDPTFNNRQLVVMTQDSNRSNYTTRSGYTLK